MPLLFSIFNSEDCKAILKIRLGGIGREAQRIWRFSKDGRLTVKSAYFILKRLQTSDTLHNRSTSFSLSNVFWKSILKLDVPHKNKNFVWRAANNSLATRENLLRRNCSSSPSSGIDVLVRNSHGVLVDGIAFSMWSLSPLAAEGEAMRQAVILAIAKNYHQAYLETDSLQLAQLFSSQSTPVWELDAISQDIRLILRSYPSISIIFTPRSANACADWIAKNVRCDNLFQVWVSNTPSQFQSQLYKDSSSPSI
ncbi:hypothetical protein P3X46_031344 [Hevea brasiliensis]|uniref:RNase H type-1 domain-containing protein n=1 Tax=Hevea brasiliensis TaxID=3981 RepID=A0ABQ9KK06_HEVBR|nr:hypothetical protein P3X46_031344 [Hevea brasiliensis]